MHIANKTHLRGWDDAIRIARGAMRNATSSELDDYFDGWMDALTERPIDATRIATSRDSYARGYAAGVREHELAHQGGYDAE
jgi:hypothetical protein